MILTSFRQGRVLVLEGGGEFYKSHPTAKQTPEKPP